MPNDSNGPQEEPLDVKSSVSEGSKGVDAMQIVSRFEAAAVAGTDVLALLRGADQLYASGEAGKELVSALADVCERRPAVLENVDFCATLVAQGSSFVAALLAHLASGKERLSVRAQIMLVGYLGRHDPEQAHARITQLSADIAARLGGADDPESERLLARQQYEGHRLAYSRAAPYLRAVAGLTLERNAPEIRQAQEQYAEAYAALQESVDLLRTSAETDRRFGHDMYANQTDNRIVALQMEGGLIPASAASRGFAELDSSYQRMDPKGLRAGDETTLRRFHANTVQRLAQVLELCDRRDEAQVARTRFAQMQAALEH